VFAMPEEVDMPVCVCVLVDQYDLGGITLRGGWH